MDYIDKYKKGHHFIFGAPFGITGGYKKKPSSIGGGLWAIMAEGSSAIVFFTLLHGGKNYSSIKKVDQWLTKIEKMRILTKKGFRENLANP